jgi:2,3-bisphosphoglycerate-dependent phosphoglycerate mutase
VAVRDTAFEILSWADTSHLADLPPQPVYEQRKPAADDDRRVT